MNRFRRHMPFIGAGLALAALCGPAAAATATAATPDCPLRNSRFSIDSPLVDLLLSDAAKAVIDRHTGGAASKLPPILSGTQAPTFGAILTFRQFAASGIVPVSADLPSLDAELGRLPVTRADRAARCARYDDDRPRVQLPPGRPRVLLFEKMTGFRDGPSVEAAHATFLAMAQRRGWALVTTDKGGAMHPSVLRQFDVVVWNNVSGDVLTLPQRRAFRAYIEHGGGFVGVHGAGGDPAYFWNWYVDELVGARFIGHPDDPQFQDAHIVVADSTAGIGAGLPHEWAMNDEWYSFAKSPRATGARVIASLDERSYAPGRGAFGGPPLTMGADHPIAWTRCVGKGRSFYSAVGHRPQTYTDATHLRLLEQAIQWAAQGKCDKAH